MTEPARPTISAPAPTAAPMLTALGATFVLAGLVTNASVTVVGVVLFVAGAVGWFREVLPHEHEAALPIEPPAPLVVPSPHAVLRLEAGEGGHRARVPVTIYPYSAGVAGGLGGGAAMAVLAVLYGLIAHESIWYTINLLAAAGSAALTSAPRPVLAEFDAQALVLAIAIHGVLSLLVGLLYGALLPMLPRHPAFWGGLVAPVMWTGLIAPALHVVNPALNERIDWWWFVATQIAFGLVAGFVVSRSAQVPTFQHAPFEGRGER